MFLKSKASQFKIIFMGAQDIVILENISHYIYTKTAQITSVILL